MSTELISTIVAIIGLLLSLGMWYLKKKKEEKLTGMVMMLQANTEGIDALKKIIQDIIISNILFTIGDNFLVRFTEKTNTDPEEYIDIALSIIEDILSNALINADTILPDAVVRKAISMLGEDSFLQYKERCIKTCKSEFIEPFMLVISSMNSHDDERTVLVAELTKLSLIASRVENPVDAVLQSSK